MGQRVGVVGVILGQVGERVEADHKRLVRLWTHHLVQKFHRCVLFKAEAVANRVARINQQSHPQRQSGLALKRLNPRRRLALVEQPYIVLLQILDEVAVLVGRGEDQIDQIDFHSNAELARLVRLLRLRLRLPVALRVHRREHRGGSPDFALRTLLHGCRSSAALAALFGGSSPAGEFTGGSVVSVVAPTGVLAGAGRGCARLSRCSRKMRLHRGRGRRQLLRILC